MFKLLGPGVDRRAHLQINRILRYFDNEPGLYTFKRPLASAMSTVTLLFRETTPRYAGWNIKRGFVVKRCFTEEVYYPEDDERLRREVEVVEVS